MEFTLLLRKDEKRMKAKGGVVVSNPQLEPRIHRKTIYDVA